MAPVGESKMLQKNGMMSSEDAFKEAYKQMEEHKDEIKRKARQVRDLLTSGDFSLPNLSPVKDQPQK